MKMHEALASARAASKWRSVVSSHRAARRLESEGVTDAGGGCGDTGGGGGHAVGGGGALSLHYIEAMKECIFVKKHACALTLKHKLWSVPLGGGAGVRGARGAAGFAGAAGGRGRGELRAAVLRLVEWGGLIR